MPAVRKADSGLLDISWYDRRVNPNSAFTAVSAALKVDPTTPITPSSDVLMNHQNWGAVSSDIIPNFGDYTDNYFDPTAGLFVAWSDGRFGDPQPFNAKKK